MTKQKLKIRYAAPATLAFIPVLSFQPSAAGANKVKVCFALELKSLKLMRDTAPSCMRPYWVQRFQRAQNQSELENQKTPVEMTKVKLSEC